MRQLQDQGMKLILPRSITARTSAQQTGLIFSLQVGAILKRLSLRVIIFHANQKHTGVSAIRYEKDKADCIEKAYFVLMLLDGKGHVKALFFILVAGK